MYALHMMFAYGVWVEHIASFYGEAVKHHLPARANIIRKLYIISQSADKGLRMKNSEFFVFLFVWKRGIIKVEKR